ncbi:MAG: hypothetical protein KGQ93_05980 [Cyanobacteria bacterium REEB459]|nr:hypothetical protein [Cyanobacteria bacterium REEB459]
MVPGWPVDSYRQRFRAIFESLVIVDVWTYRQTESGSNLGEWDCNWRSLFLAIAASGEDPLPPAWGQALQQLARHNRAALLLAVLPMLLLYSNPYGHQRQRLQRWAETMGLDDSTLLHLDQSFQHLCLTMVTPPPWSPPTRFCCPAINELAPEAILKPIETLVRASQGEFLPALQLAYHGHSSAVTLSLVGVLVAWRGGLPALPTHLRQFHLPSSHLTAHWGADYGEQLSHLAEQLYCRWAGAQPCPQSVSSLVIL